MKIRLNAFKRAILSWYNHDPFSQSAAISYYTIFSFPALAFIYLSLASIFADEADVQKQVTSYFSKIVGPDDAVNIQQIIEKSAPAYTNFWALAFGAVILLFAGLKLFLQLQKTLNYIWQVKVAEHISIWTLVKQRMAAFSVMLGVLFIMLTSLLVTALVTSLGEYISDNVSESLMVIVYALNFVISLSIISFVFTILLKLLPDVEIQWKYALTGGAFSAVLFVLGQYLISLYFSIVKPASAYGVTASIILLMLWVSYTCAILLLGTELTKVILEDNTEKPKPTKLAVKK